MTLVGKLQTVLKYEQANNPCVVLRVSVKRGGVDSEKLWVSVMLSGKNYESFKANEKYYTQGRMIAAEGCPALKAYQNKTTGKLEIEYKLLPSRLPLFAD